MSRWAILALSVLLVLLAPPISAVGATATDEHPDAAAAAATLGISVAQAERRLAARAQLDPAIAFIQTSDEDFGGVYLDLNGALVIGLLPGRAQARDAVMSLLPPDADVEWLTYEHSSATLRAVRDDLVTRIPEFALDGAPFTAAGIDVVRNAVVLKLDGPVSAVRDKLADEFGTMLDVQAGGPIRADACNSRYDCTPWRGGISIGKTPGPASGVCSYGFNARQYDGTAMRMLTAGHCENATWYHRYGLIGSTALNLFDTSQYGLGDLQRVHTTFSGTKNLIYVQDSDKTRTITGTRNNSLQLVGDLVCKTGIGIYSNGGGYRCGLITDADEVVLFPYHGHNYPIWMKGASYLSTVGDSGGPVFVDHTALGIHSGAIGSVRYYSTVENAEFALVVEICTDAACS